ncbi:peptidase associated/transthyretin-like domain-containing protein [Flavobacterium hiemivividum]|uniref:Carboxypeptidase-like regulatory domain-containing protein n=1 Tax=Flavobacterium hiemivividum TaxID=2541734 RepID=A0A4R5CLP1_9FLAO|nr:hypothetical protein [Flavobacterium hiemivividum]TDE00866.1 hypothetical protein E0F98_15665 [Flavobacterium hiemivividum]
MKVKLLSVLILFTSQFSFSQTIKGKVVFNNYAIPSVEVINATTKTLTVSDSNGEFSINAKTSDILVFVSKEHQVKKITISPTLFTKNQLVVELILKAEELNEVLITNIPSIKLGTDLKWEQSKLQQYALEKKANTPKVLGVNMGGIDNGINFMQIGGLLAKLFQKEKEPKKKIVPTISFKDFVKKNCNEDYFIKTLQLKPDQIELFLQFCEADPKSKIVVANNNTLSTMDFLFIKNEEFKKLAATKK